MFVKYSSYDFDDLFDSIDLTLDGSVTRAEMRDFFLRIGKILEREESLQISESSKKGKKNDILNPKVNQAPEQ